MRKKPDILATRVTARSRLFRIEELDLRFANGATATYERLLGAPQGAVLMVPLLGGETLLLVREYCAGVDRYELAFPKGRIEGQEDPEAAAQRELMEETGYGARRWARLATVTLAPGYFGHRTHLLLGEGLYPQRRAGDEPEPVEVVPWPLARWAALLEREDFTEARSLLALYLARQALGRATP